MIAAAIRCEIIRKIKESKYFSVILDCTPDISHQEQMSLIIRYVDTSSDSIHIEESFLGFLDINDTTGQGLFDVLQNELKNLDFDIDNVRGQGYDNIVILCMNIFSLFVFYNIVMGPPFEFCTRATKTLVRPCPVKLN